MAYFDQQNYVPTLLANHRVKNVCSKHTEHQRADHVPTNMLSTDNTALINGDALFECVRMYVTLLSRSFCMFDASRHACSSISCRSCTVYHILQISCASMPCGILPRICKSNLRIQFIQQTKLRAKFNVFTIATAACVDTKKRIFTSW